MMHDPHDDLNRRGFLKALGASLALAGLDGCTRIPAEKILPYVSEPPELTPGIPVHYATSMVLDGYATGLVVEANEGRPTKIEGNPDHPASLGAAGALEQASLLQLYDPDRGRNVRLGRSASSWGAFTAAMNPAALKRRVGASGERLALLLEPTSSALIADRLDALRALYPAARIYFHSPLSSPVDAAFTTSGVVPHYDIRSADVILSAGSDFLAEGPFNLRYAREFADRRRTPAAGMNRLYVAECGLSVTGGAADHRLRCRPGTLDAMLDALLGTLRGGSSASPWVRAVADDLRAHAGRSVVIAGERQSARIHALAAAINDTLQNTGRTVWFSASPLLSAADPNARMPALIEGLRSGAVDTLVCIGGNPSYATPGALGVSSLIRRVPNSVYVGLYDNETARDTQWYVPAGHYLESWGDAQAYDGTYSLVQPLVQPLFEGKSCVEVLSALAGQPAADVRTMLRDVAIKQRLATNENDWSPIVARGFAPRPAAPHVTATPRPELLEPPTATASPGATIDVIFERDASVHDGSFANNGWLQELPDPITKLTWDNAALLSAATAQRVGVATGDIITLQGSGSTLRIPVIILPGQPDELATLHFGYGRRGAEHVARDVGVDVFAFQPSLGAYSMTAVSVARTGARRDLAITQSHWTMEGRDQARSESLATYREAKPRPPQRQPLTIYDPQPFLTGPQQWAMTIDLGTCIGCSACVVACQAENNIPVVGRDDVIKSREMQWMRIDRYFEGPGADPEMITQPMLCQHCENAPCEYVCPVGATMHSPEGLNEMVYNRCVGTRFCSNNCPYKVRRFNWFDYNAHLTDTEKMVKNPDVTVRERGVMEKCTFCVQRIREAEIAAGVAGRPIHGDDVKTACQQSCPTNAIVFGSLTEPSSDVVRRRQDGRAYSVLDELGTVPRVQYLSRVRNLNPALEAGTTQ